MVSAMDEHASDYKVVETPAGRCYQKPQPPTVEYVLMSDEDMIPRQLQSFPTLEAAYRSKRAADWVVAVENGTERPFNVEEEAALVRMRDSK